MTGLISPFESPEVFMSFSKLLLDVDGTLLNFDASAEKALETLFDRRHYVYSDRVFERYTVINNGLWEKHERGEMPRDRVLTERFTMLFAELGIDEEGAAFEHDFRDQLEKDPVWMDGAEDILKYLQPKYEMYIVTNGVGRTQRARLAATGLDRYVKDVFISEVIGAQKPQKAYFDYCLAHIGPYRLSELLLIGDSLTADILGANRAWITSCWFNPHGKPLTGEARPDYEIRQLSELKSLL